MLVSRIQSVNQVPFRRRGEEGHGGGGTYDGVEVDAGPDKDGGMKGQEDEWSGGEAECGLCNDVRGEVVVRLVRGGLGAVRSKEERADVAADVCTMSVTCQTVMWHAGLERY